MQRIHRGQLLKTLGLPERQPADLSGRWQEVPVHEWWTGRIPHRPYSAWGYLTIVLLTSNEAARRRPKSRFGHRLMVECTCGRLIPCGRFHQHVHGAK